MKRMPSAKTLNALLDYEPTSGHLTWRSRGEEWFSSTERFSAQAQANIWNGKNAGKLAFSRVGNGGYLVGCLLGHPRKAHRIIWKMETGTEPDIIDHINGDKTDNRLCNLRNTDSGGNAKNQKIYETSKTGRVGISLMKNGRYKAQIGNNGATEYLGCFQTLGDAVSARTEAELRLYYHKNHGRTDGERIEKRETEGETGHL